MPRRSAAALSVAPVAPPRLPARTPSHLPSDVGALWLDLVETAPAGHFGPCDLLLLETLATCLVRLRALHANVAKGDVEALDELERIARTAGALASKLRLSASSSSRIETARGKPGPRGIDALLRERA